MDSVNKTSSILSHVDPVISVVVPMYNEAPNILPFYERASKVLNNLGIRWEIICVNDGSQDETLACLLRLRHQVSEVKVIDLSRNFGKEIALSAGIDHAQGEAVISVDADLQHPPKVFPKLIEKWRRGSEIVFAVRSSRSKEGLAKRASTSLFYRILGMLTDIPNAYRIGDFCLLDRCVVDTLKHLPEHNRFMKGLFSWVGFKQDFVTYEPEERKTGNSKWNYWRLWNFAIQGITSFSDVPVKIWTYIGFGISSLCFLYGTFIVMRTLLLGIDVPGYASLIVSILFMGGIQLVGLGILGEYIARIYNEVKARPLYIIRGLHGFAESESEEKTSQAKSAKDFIHR